MKVLVTGASGFLGSHVAEQLAKQGHEVRAMVRKTSDTKFLRVLPNVVLVEGAVEDRDACLAAAKDIDAVVHSAGLVKARTPAEFHLTNVVGTQNMLDAALAQGDAIKRFVLVSSLTARAPSPDGSPLPLDAEPRPLTAYGRSKLEAERLALRLKDKLHITVVRPTGIYGPRDREMMQLFQYAAMRVLPYMGDPQGKLTLIHGEDCARAIVLCLTAEIPSGRGYDIDDGAIYTRAELAEGLEGAMQKKAWVSFPIPDKIIYGVGLLSETYGRIANKAVMLKREKVTELLQQWVGDSAPARKELGFEARYRWSDGAKLTAAWYKENGWL
ncbi:MAG: NAD(P)-dependent oxidoreductase [Deltaproteobacteria bacterium]|nr:NAD(P)-dependent oxidoreductase [Deltaproteobacteria bacterium]